MNSLGDRIRSLRHSQNITQKQLANRVGIIEATLSKYENGHRDSKWEILSKIADALDTNTDYLLCRTNISIPSKDIKLSGEINPKHIEILLKYDKLSPEHQLMVMERMDTLLEIQNKK